MTNNDVEPTLVRPAGPDDRAAIDAVFMQTWGGMEVAAGGRLYDLRDFPTLIALGPNGAIVGVLTYEIAGDALEVVSIEATRSQHGAGTALLAAAVEVARAAGLARLWLVTTNDNLGALRFYQRRGLSIIDIRPDGVTRSRALKPSIPLIGSFGIPMRDELVLSMSLEA